MILTTFYKKYSKFNFIMKFLCYLRSSLIICTAFVFMVQPTFSFTPILFVNSFSVSNFLPSSSLLSRCHLSLTKSEKDAADAVLYGGGGGSNLGENNFGDIMGGCETEVFVEGSYSPIERIVLSANGNLQRIMSAYYGAKVEVKVLRCDRLPGTVATYDREVDLYVAGKKFGNAKGKIAVLNEECVKAIESKTVGVGQLFRYLRALPSFRLLKVWREPKTLTLSDSESLSLCRHYILQCPQVLCEFTETFEPNFLDANFLLDKM